MDATTKKCPMCAEQIPLDATVCEYCGTKFEVISKEGRAVSKIIEEPIASPSAARQDSIPAQIPTRRIRWIWPVVIVVIFITGIIGGLLWSAGKGESATTQPSTTVTRVSTRIPTPNYKATLLAQSPKPTSTIRPIQSPFIGQWSALDPDGSRLQLTISVDNSGVFQLTYYDEWANVCGSPLTVSATATLDPTDPNLLIVHWVINCASTSKQVIFTSKYQYEKEQDSIKEVFEDDTSITWHRSR